MGGLHHAMPRGSQRRNGEDEYRQQCAAGPQQEGVRPEDRGHISAPRIKTEEGAPQRLGYAQGDQRTKGHRRNGQQRTLHQRQQADLERGGPAALQHGYLGGAGLYHQHGHQDEVINEHAGHQEHYQVEGDPGLEKLPLVVIQHGVEAYRGPGTVEVRTNVVLDLLNGPLKVVHVPRVYPAPVQVEEPCDLCVQARI